MQQKSFVTIIYKESILNDSNNEFSDNLKNIWTRKILTGCSTEWSTCAKRNLKKRRRENDDNNYCTMWTLLAIRVLDLWEGFVKFHDELI